MEIETKSYPTPAVWSNDCQGKKDYDGLLVLLNTRYWPGSYQLNEQPSAVSELSIQFGEPDENGYTFDSLALLREEFEAPTEGEVKQLVEVWAQQQMNRVVAALKAEFDAADPKSEPGDGEKVG